MKLKILFAAISLTVLTQSVNASTVQNALVVAYGSTGPSYAPLSCNDGGDGQQSETATCPEFSLRQSFGRIIEGEASARATFGNLGVKATTRESFSGNFSSQVRAGATVQDSLAILDGEEFLANNPDVERVRLLLPVTINGSLTGTGSNGGYGFASGSGNVFFDYSGNDIFGNLGGTLFSQEVSIYNGLFQVLNTTGSLGTTTLGFDLLSRGLISEGLTIRFGLSTRLSCKSDGDAYCELSSSFFESAILGPGTLVDQNGSEIFGLELSSESGYSYLTGTTPVTPVPIGASFPLLLAALSFLALPSCFRKSTVASA